MEAYENQLRKLAMVSSKNHTVGYFETPLLFRGQPGQEEIVATLFRNKLGIEITTVEDVNRSFVDEFKTICNWVSRANKVGIQFNFDIWEYLHEKNLSLVSFVRGEEYIEGHYPVLSISRHNGCINRLIDFTKDGHAAFFFALKGAFENIEKQYLLYCNENEQLGSEKAEAFKEWLKSNFAVVWVIEENERNNSDILFPDYGNNKYALAQSAVFIIAPLSTRKEGFSPEKIEFSKSLDYYGFNLHRKFKIPYSNVPDILWNLDRKAINLIRYFPSPESISANGRLQSSVIKMKNMFLSFQD